MVFLDCCMTMTRVVKLRLHWCVAARLRSSLQRVASWIWPVVHVVKFVHYVRNVSNFSSD